MSGSKPQQPQFVQPPPPQVTQLPPPNIMDQTRQLTEAQGQYGPQQAQQEYDLRAQYGPMYKALLTSLYPELGAFQQQVNQRLTSPTGYSADQQSAIDATRNREQERGLRGIREGANLGGTLYSGNRQRAETDYLTQQGQAYTTQDIGFQQQQQAANLQALISLLQLSNPQVQQPNVTASPDALLAAYQQNQIVNPAQLAQGVPGSAGAWPGIAQAGIGAAGTIGAAALL